MTDAWTSSLLHSRWQTPEEVEGVPGWAIVWKGLPSLNSWERWGVIACMASEMKGSTGAKLLSPAGPAGPPNRTSCRDGPERLQSIPSQRIALSGCEGTTALVNTGEGRVVCCSQHLAASRSLLSCLRHVPSHVQQP